MPYPCHLYILYYIYFLNIIHSLCGEVKKKEQNTDTLLKALKIYKRNSQKYTHSHTLSHTHGMSEQQERYKSLSAINQTFRRCHLHLIPNLSFCSIMLCLLLSWQHKDLQRFFGGRYLTLYNRKESNPFFFLSLWCLNLNMELPLSQYF